MIASGMSNLAASKVLGVSDITLACWLDDGMRQKHQEQAARWQNQNKERVNELAKKRRKLMTQEQRDKHAHYNRKRYQNNPKFREALKRYAMKARLNPDGQVRIREKIRRAVLGWSGRHCVVFGGFMKSVTGMSREEFSKKFSGDGTFDHIIPLRAFDLTNPEHVVRACHPSNIQLLPAKENTRKHAKCPEGLDVMALPWVGTEEALLQTKAFLARQFSRLEKARNGTPEFGSTLNPTTPSQTWR